MAPSTGDYDQVVALTQQMINNGLQDMYAVNKAEAVGTGNPADAPIADFGPGNFAFKNFKLGSPRVVVKYSEEDKYHVLYQIHIVSGSFVTQKSWTSKEVSTWSIENWYLSCPVNFALENINDEVLLKKLKETHNIPGDYSIQRLIMNLKDPDISAASTTLSYFGGYEKDKEPKLSADNLNNIKILMSTIADGDHATMMHMKDLSTLGYVADSGKNQNIVNSPSATFVPCGVQFQTYPYKANSGLAGDGTFGNSRLNYLCYLEKTYTPGESAAPSMPSGDGKYLKYTGNWTSGSIATSNSKDNIPDDLPLGTFVMSSKNFIGEYLLPKLRDITARMCIGFSGVNAGAWADSTWRMGIDLSINNPKNISDSDYKLTKSQNGQSTVWTFSKNWPWQQSTDEGAQQILAGAETRNEMKVITTADSATISVQGSSWIRLYSEVWWGIRGHAISKGDDEHRTFKWSFDLVLQSVNDGGLQILMQNKKHSVEYGPNDRRDLKDKYGGIIDWLENWFNTFNFNNLGDLENVLANDIGRASKLVFPCSGAFYYKNPVMTDKGDLMCTVRYKPSGMSFPSGEKRATPPILAQTASEGIKTDDSKTKDWT